MIGKKQQAAETEMTPAERLAKVTKAIVARVTELRALQPELEAAENACRAEGGALSAVPSSYTGVLWQALEYQWRTWRAHRRDLVSGGPPPASPLEDAIRGSRSALQRAKDMTIKYETMLREPGKASDRQALSIARDWAESVSREQRRLLELLAQLPQTSEIRRERLELSAAADKGTSITLFAS